ncbi:MAG: hypothetical protein HFI33_07470 [Lachnospiraceae bacterium]|nr:hypothetical protein [Lachnospiraceae bacterium]
MMEKLQDVLYEREKVLWEGKPEPFSLLDDTYKQPLLITWGVSIAVVAAFLAFYIPFYLRTEGTPTQLITALVLIGLIPFSLSIQPLTTKRSLDKKVTYLFTNQRAICINDTQINTFNITRETPCKLQKLPNGSSVIYMGEDGCKIKPTASRNAAVRRIKTPDSPDLTGMVFYGVKDAMEVCKSFAPFSNVSEV